MSLLSIENLSVEYIRRGKTIQALKDFSLTMEPGEMVGLVGGSGSGKSTVAQAILRLIRPQEGQITKGRILFNGKDLLSLSEEDMRQIRGREIAMVFQDPFTALNPVMTVGEQMEEALTAHEEQREGKREERKVSHHSSLLAVLRQVQLDSESTLRRYPHQLSGGQRQRICIAMALLNKPKLLIADEPTTALDVLVQKEIMDLLAALQKKTATALLFISHHTALVNRYAQRKIILEAAVSA